MEIVRTIEDSDVYWEMDWGPVPYGVKGKVGKEIMFEEEPALALLLINDVLIINSNWWEKDWPEAARDGFYIGVKCSDTFAYACADSEDLHPRDIESLYKMWIKDPMWGPTAWCVQKRKERPIPPVERGLREMGYPLDEWGLKDNTSNAETQAAIAAAKAALAENKRLLDNLQDPQTCEKP